MIVPDHFSIDRISLGVADHTQIITHSSLCAFIKTLGLSRTDFSLRQQSMIHQFLHATKFSKLQFEELSAFMTTKDAQRLKTLRGNPHGNVLTTHGCFASGKKCPAPTTEIGSAPKKQKHAAKTL